MAYRSTESSVVGMAEAIQPGLLVWGRIEGGRVVLEPAFRITARPSLPRRPGPYHLEGRSGDGGRLFSLDFAPVEVADDPLAAKHFAFVVPLRAERAERVASLHLNGPGASASTSMAAATPTSVQVSRTGAGSLRLRWDAPRHPW